MRNPFKKYGHRKTRYDQMKEFDRQVKSEEKAKKLHECKTSKFEIKGIKPSLIPNLIIPEIEYLWGKNAI